MSVPTIHGSVKVPVPAGSNNGKILRLKGKGIKPAKGKNAGDQLVTLRVVLPKTVDADLKSFMETWRKDHAYTVRQDGENT